MAKAEDKCEIWAVDEEKVAKTKARLPSDETFMILAETFSALADSNRAKILHSLADQELCVCDVACVVGISESAISQHLRILRTLRLVKQRKEGRMMYYSLADEHIRQLLETCLDHSRHH
ncbi:metalloregulator ArsR/SmtB family transcription factor [Dehalogenimonas sp. 4OHTPN]|uniref:Metalloregulator ArsR/SmtB family transcription factor n=1 Tax=Dehalogenimonas sp. 4OHTPN TaxID=3166643 RepID=A0AAU8GC57_9CHLR